MTSMTELQYIDRLLQIFRRSGIYNRPHDEDLNDADIMVLYCIGFCEDLKNIKLSDIATRLKVTLPAVTHKVQTLEHAGLIKKEKDTKDKRITYVKLTDKGQTYVLSSKKTYYQPLKQILESIGKEDTLHLIRILEKISNR
jgi:DNA-binding MarR family transcriptional regulator